MTLPSSLPGHGTKSLVVSLHDLHPGSLPQITEQIETLQRWGVPRTSLLIVPEFHHTASLAQDSAFAAKVDAWIQAGHEPVLHGFYHDRLGQADAWRHLFWTRLYTSREAEFLDLPPEESRSRLQRGLDLFHSLQWKPQGFIAPAWLMPPHLPAQLWEMGFTYTNTLTTLIAQNGRQTVSVPSQSLCYSTRAAWRRQASLLWNPSLYRRLSGQSLIRLSLHPDDLTFPAIRHQIERIVGQALTDQYEPATYADTLAKNRFHNS